jgi:hypothetical protein
MMHNNPYEWAIQGREIAQRLGCNKDDIEAIGQERQRFGVYCRWAAVNQIYFSDQIEAWKDYELRYPAEPSKKDMVLVIEPEPPLTYESEMRKDFERRAQFGNYTDYGGQQ